MILYLIIPSINVDTRSDELANIEGWSRKNNITLNRSKSQEIIFIEAYHPTSPRLPMSARSRFSELLCQAAYLCVDMSTTLSHLVHKVFRPCEYFGHMAWQLALFTRSLMLSSLQSSHIGSIIVVGLYDSRGSSTTGSGHSSWHPFGTLRS